MNRVPGVLRTAIIPGRFTYRMSFTCCGFETQVCRARDSRAKLFAGPPFAHGGRTPTLRTSPHKGDP